MVFGKKGSGKTTYLTKTCLKYLKKGRPVYSTVPIPGAYYFNPEDIGFYSIPSESVILIDEVGWYGTAGILKGLKRSIEIILSSSVIIIIRFICLASLLILIRTA